MEKPAYTIGRDEMLLITVRWNDGDTVLLETPVRFYKAEEIQALIDETVSDKCDVVGVDLYDFKAKKGQSIADDFDVRTWAEREEDRIAAEGADELAQERILRRGTGVYSALNHVQQGIGARA
ncbi:hypothetical protein ASF69_04450 [Rhizobium sp. Leaf311]|uniref:hypothetical protein n=1 Tax=Rhizobium sp. Leaf311 TaxID=1736332 RepID=UPI000715156D|nr:hypothetical protein [Rhizobium sp. Leaf311]KQQ46485.1 hypothetical protein ASF69_04450 [Rhizobium sp. Leaf311]